MADQTWTPSTSSINPDKSFMPATIQPEQNPHSTARRIRVLLPTHMGPANTPHVIYINNGGGQAAGSVGQTGPMASLSRPMGMVMNSSRLAAHHHHLQPYQSSSQSYYLPGYGPPPLYYAAPPAFHPLPQGAPSPGGVIGGPLPTLVMGPDGRPRVVIRKRVQQPTPVEKGAVLEKKKKMAGAKVAESEYNPAKPTQEQVEAAKAKVMAELETVRKADFSIKEELSMLLSSSSSSDHDYAVPDLTSIPTRQLCTLNDLIHCPALKLTGDSGKGLPFIKMEGEGIAVKKEEGMKVEELTHDGDHAIETGERRSPMATVGSIGMRVHHRRQGGNEYSFIESAPKKKGPTMKMGADEMKYVLDSP